MKKFAVRVLSAVGILAAAFVLGSLLVTKAVASTNINGGWSACVSSGPQCGSDNGTQSKTESRDHNHACPSGYSDTGHNDSWSKDCRKELTSGHWELNERSGPCPDNNSSDTCDQDSGHHHHWVAETTYDYQDKVIQYEDCSDGWVVNPSNSEQCQKTQACQTGVIDNSACVTTNPTPVPQGNGFGLPGDGRSDGQSDGRSSCPDCTKAPSGQVLGASTDFAGTGSAVDMLVNAIGAAGGLSTAVGLALIGKKKS
jgi:hypothetical protein